MRKLCENETTYAVRIALKIMALEMDWTSEADKYDGVAMISPDGDNYLKCTSILKRVSMFENTSSRVYLIMKRY